MDKVYITRTLNYITVFSALSILILSAYCTFTIPISETGIPFTLQSLAVFVLGGLLRPKDIFVVIITYLLLGVTGLPVFAEGSAGISKLTGASGGFLYGFLFSSLFIAFTVKSTTKRPLAYYIAVMLLATLVLFAFGLAHLTVKLNLEKAITYGLMPFWKMALVKAIMAAVTVYLVTFFTNNSDKVKDS